MDRSSSNYKLVIAEKPDAALRIAESLGRATKRRESGGDVFEVTRAFDEDHYVICSASGHLYGLADPSGLRRIYPVFDLGWFPLDISNSSWANGKKRRYSNYVSKRIRLISSLSQNADEIIHACDYDLEGETIGYNIIIYALGESSRNCSVFRARFSTLTKEDILYSFSHLEPLDSRVADAGRSRHEIDFLWGVNLSRAISESYRKANGVFRNFAIGRVQGPTLSFVAKREIEIQCHIPIPYWSILMTLEKNSMNFEASYERERIETKEEADSVFSHVSKQTVARTVNVKEEFLKERPPCPFSLSDLQKESYRLFKLGPAQTVSLAERLYLRALISYPRTNSQKLPPSIGFSKIISTLLRQPEFAVYSNELREGVRRGFPVQGYKDDPAHPAIYPTGVTPANSIRGVERKIYDLIVRRFLSTFARDALWKESSYEIDVGGLGFLSRGKTLLEVGWRDIYPALFEKEILLPTLETNELVRIVTCNLKTNHSDPPRRYSQSSLLQKMEQENIGTKATRSEIILELISKAYLTDVDGSLEAGETGLVLVSAMEKYSPPIVSVQLTRDTEQEIDNISSGSSTSGEFLATNMRIILNSLDELRKSEREIAASLSQIRPTLNDNPKAKRPQSRIVLGKCPTCKSGELVLIRSMKTHKRFIGCSNYKSGCKATAPVPQRGILRSAGKCPKCSWPKITIILHKSERKTWVLCPNPSCTITRRN